MRANEAQQLPSMRTVLPTGDGVTLTLLADLFMQEVGGGPTAEHWTSMTYDVRGPDRAALAQVVLIRRGDKTEVAGFHVAPGPADSVNDFDLEAVRGSYVFVGIQMVVAFICITACVAALRTRGLRWKWLWAAGCLLGFCTFTLDFGTGHLFVQPLSFLLLGVAAVKPDFASPWAFQFALPVVALVFLCVIVIPRWVAEGDRKALEKRSPSP